ncbi:hypothetical protein [Cyanobium sp. To12R1]|nr:hypothetical protein [Cyanobium sp. To12R1]MCP9779333.1 hypothetical protein [Cyanobium sp. To12R1]
MPAPAIDLGQIRSTVALVTGARLGGDRRLLQTPGAPPPRQLNCVEL